jgi:hypothetical protein
MQIVNGIRELKAESLHPLTYVTFTISLSCFFKNAFEPRSPISLCLKTSASKIYSGSRV